MNFDSVCNNGDGNEVIVIAPPSIIKSSKNKTSPLKLNDELKHCRIGNTHTFVEICGKALDKTEYDSGSATKVLREAFEGQFDAGKPFADCTKPQGAAPDYRGWTERRIAQLR